MELTRREKLIWLACAIDTDGTISLSKGTHGMNVGIGFSNTFKGITDVFEEYSNEIACRTYRGRSARQHYCSVRGTRELPGNEDKLHFLKQILPFLIVKEERAKSAIFILEQKIRRKLIAS